MMPDLIGRYSHIELQPSAWLFGVPANECEIAWIAKKHL
jgi:hypothetical protein